MRNIDIVAAGGNVRGYLKSVGVNHIAKAPSIEGVKNLLENCSASCSDIFATALTTVYGDGAQASVEVGDDIITTLSVDGNEATVNISSLITGGYISDLFVNLIKNTDLKLRA